MLRLLFSSNEFSFIKKIYKKTVFSIYKHLCHFLSFYIYYIYE